LNCGTARFPQRLAFFFALLVIGRGEDDRPFVAQRRLNHCRREGGELSFASLSPAMGFHEASSRSSMFQAAESLAVAALLTTGLAFQHQHP
jgi:hypothetical protein